MSDIQDEIFYGAILDENTISPKDYILGGDSDLSVKLKLVPINLAPTIQYNQRLVYESRNFCTIYSAMGMLGDIKNVTFTNEQILEVGRLGVAAGWLDPNS